MAASPLLGKVMDVVCGREERKLSKWAQFRAREQRGGRAWGASSHAWMCTGTLASFGAWGQVGYIAHLGSQEK